MTKSGASWTAFVLLGSLGALGCDSRDIAAAREMEPHAAHVRGGGHPAGILVTDPPAYALITDGAAWETRGSLHLSVTPMERPPRRVEEVFGGNAVFGYAWVDLETGAGVAATIHPSFRDSRQNPFGWHTHVVQLAGGAGSADFCLVSASPNTPGGISIRPDEVRVNIAKAHAGMSAEALDAVAAFFVGAEAGCASGLGVMLSDDPELL